MMQCRSAWRESVYFVTSGNKLFTNMLHPVYPKRDGGRRNSNMNAELQTVEYQPAMYYTMKTFLNLKKIRIVLLISERLYHLVFLA